MDGHFININELNCIMAVPYIPYRALKQPLPNCLNGASSTPSTLSELLRFGCVYVAPHENRRCYHLSGWVENSAVVPPGHD